MSAAKSPITPTDSWAGTLQPGSTGPSSPMTDLTLQDTKIPLEGTNGENGENGKEKANVEEGHPSDSVEDIEGMDTKSKALMHLLKTSSVSCSHCLTLCLWLFPNHFMHAGICCYYV